MIYTFILNNTWEWMWKFHYPSLYAKNLATEWHLQNIGQTLSPCVVSKSKGKRMVLIYALTWAIWFSYIFLDLVNEVMAIWPSTIEQVDDSGWIPLHIAAHLANNEFVKLLLKYRKSTDKMGFCPFLQN